ncbi:MAG: hypothetical protein KGL39_44490 [Patescibacteria group bacterium]|nr:hypothetical protein [Patescibacteria group bacterium]
MITLPAPISDAERAVAQYKHELLVRVMAHIVRRALAQAYVSANDVPEDIVEKEHRQGVASNAWNALRAIQIIEAVPLAFSDPARGIFGGRIQNKNEHRKGAWVTVYRLRSRSTAVTWANANRVRLEDVELCSGGSVSAAVQMQLTFS